MPAPPSTHDDCSPGGKHAEGHPHCAGGGEPPTEPEVCTDDFPSFVYSAPVRNNPDELRLSSSEGCRTEFLVHADPSTGLAFSYNNNRGLVAWTEGADDYDIYALRFTFDPSTNSLNVDAPYLVLATTRPTNTEFFFDVDSWTDYSGVSDIERLVIRRLTVADSRATPKIIQDASCREPWFSIQLETLSS